jgi:hypothetical protein
MDEWHTRSGRASSWPVSSPTLHWKHQSTDNLGLGLSGFGALRTCTILQLSGHSGGGESLYLYLSAQCCDVLSVCIGLGGRDWAPLCLAAFRLVAIFEFEKLGPHSVRE